jgi:hypothetical protein
MTLINEYANKYYKIYIDLILVKLFYNIIIIIKKI